MSSVEELLEGIVQSVEQARASLENTQTTFVKDSELLFPSIIKQIIESSGKSPEGVSLLSLKSSSLLSYINNLVLIVLSHLNRMNGEADTELLKEKAVVSSIQQRVTLEKGIRPLEKKLSYQLDKMVRSFHRMEEDSAKSEQQAAEQAVEGAGTEQSSGSESSESDSDEDALSYRPDAAALAKAVSSKKSRSSKRGSSETSEKPDKYRPPKISAVAPPTAAFDDRAAPKQTNRKLQSMEEYLAESSDLPQAEASIGATIMNHGRGGVKTSREREKERAVQRYEEDNFTRLPTIATKKTYRQKMAERANTFAGEDWSMFNNSRNIKESTSRKRKSGSAWDRVKRRRQ